MLRTLYGKLALALLVIIAILSVVCLAVNLWTTRLYLQEVNQALHVPLAENLVKDKELMLDGEVQTEALQAVFDRLMVINPTIECYLLDRSGRIVAFSAKEEEIARLEVDIEPLERFIRREGQLPILGHDPRDAEGKKVFSAAPLQSGEGYLYVVLGGERYDSILHMLQGSYILRLGGAGLAVSLACAFLAALLLFGVMTRRLRALAAAMETFQRSNFTERVPLKGRYDPDSGNEIDRLGVTFREMADRMIEQVERLTEADTLRRELVANVSHDLRTPLTTLQGYLETLILKEDRLSVEQKNQYLRTAARHSERLSKLVSELFELAKLDAYKIEMHREPCAVGELAQDVVQKFQLTAEQRNVRLEPELIEDLPLVEADVSLIERALENLIDNALRHTGPGGRVTVSVERHSGGVRVRVADTGCGISPQDLPYLFNRFYRVQNGEREASSGAGLGLAITKKILELHGSSVEVRSQQGEGTAFSFKLAA